MKVEKEILPQGTYTYIHPQTGSPEKLVADLPYLQHLHDSGNAMLAAGLSVPVPLEHQPDAKPLTQAERAAKNLLNNAGWTDKYELRDVTVDGRKEKSLYGIFDIPDPEIAKKLPHTIKFTSPWLTSFTDGDGKEWRNVIGHNALTTRPRIVRQQPFAHDMAAALSLVGKLSATKPADGAELSRAGLLRKDKAGSLKPAFPMAFSLFTGVKLSKEEMDEVVADEEAAADEEADVAQTDERESPLDAVPDATPGVDEDVKIHEMIGHLLKALGFNPPDGMDETTFVRDIYETLMAKVQEMGAEHKALKDKPEEPENKEPELDTGTNPVMQEMPSMYASLDEVKKIKDPKERRLAEMVFSLRESVLEPAKAARERRIERLCKRLPQNKRDDLLRSVAAPSARLSLDDDGKVVDPVGSWLSVMESMTPDIGVDLSTAKEQPHPADGPYSPERHEAVMAEVLKAGGSGRPAA